MRRNALSLFLALFLVMPASAQDAVDADSRPSPPDPATPQGENMAVPEGWKFRLDRPNDDARLIATDDVGHNNVHFVNMTPGWHITTGPAVILYHPGLFAEGDFRAEAEYHLFPPGDRNEAFGIFIGGRDLEGADQAYLYFLLRKTGEFLIKRRDGSSTHDVQGWTAHPAIVPYTSETEGSVANVLAVETAPESLTFFVNDQEVASLPREDLPVNGLVGLRVNHALNVHVSDLKVVPLD